jgi:hypothetical protein
MNLESARFGQRNGFARFDMKSETGHRNDRRRQQGKYQKGNQGFDHWHADCRFRSIPPLSGRPNQLPSGSRVPPRNVHASRMVLGAHEMARSRMIDGFGPTRKLAIIRSTSLARFARCVASLAEAGLPPSSDDRSE